jgi:hypothetical protein
MRFINYLIRDYYYFPQFGHIPSIGRFAPQSKHVIVLVAGFFLDAGAFEVLAAFAFFILVSPFPVL